MLDSPAFLYTFHLKFKAMKNIKFTGLFHLKTQSVPHSKHKNYPLQKLSREGSFTSAARKATPPQMIDRYYTQTRQFFFHKKKIIVTKDV